ncbi:SpoIIE family protein phosphatase [Actinomadura sp. ATCC 31491]|uniref:histidine kinase n=1 Tax=Actinomadura luzonensis TaxID=2805427 RepID=A0ABT0FTY1_9ACTN|nr:SpoIIE family protein phosphatase [Actinomadura luzonensis]MCK2215781.1 SpoIIE family protein phosphatase [Actinomadura luzonensis]
MVDTPRAEWSEAVFPGTSEMAARMRAHRWADTPMGDPSTWPQSLRTALRICLTSRFPMIVWWGRELRFFYNDAYLPLLGSNHPALGKRGDHVWGEIWHIIGPMLESVLATGRATWSEDLLLPLHRHGYLEETYWTHSYSPLHDDDGEVGGVFTAVSDTTQRVVGERRLALLRDLGSQAGKARSVAEACELVARALGRAARDVPFAAIYLRRPGRTEPYAAEPYLAAATPADADPAALVADGAHGWPITQVLRGGGASTVSDLARRFPPLPAGDWRTPPAQAVVLPLGGEAGTGAIGAIVLAVGAGRALDDGYLSFLSLVARQTADLVNAAVAYEGAERRAAELAELDQARTTFFANISHEFRTPLALITGPLEELRARLGDGDERTREELEVVHRNALRLGKLVDTLLDFSRIEAGRMQARFEPVDLAAVTAELAGAFRSAMARAGLALEVDCRPLAEPVHVDRGMWEKVLLNLLSNALKFTFEGSVTVTVRQEGRHAAVRIADTGVGVAEHELPRLFERFHRIHNARARSDEGSGIGLALVRELVGLHGGTITAESRPGEGTAFTVRLPLGPPRAETGPAAGGERPAAADGAGPYLEEALRWLPGETAPDGRAGPGGPGALDMPEALPVPDALRVSGAPARVLVADDNADMRRYLARLLRGAGYRVRTVADGQAALESVLADPPDLVISDVMMPRLDGLRLLAALRADPRVAGVPVLLLSARTGPEASVQGLAAGADDYLVKPFTTAELLARARANVEMTRLRAHHARWREALLDSLREAFFVCDQDGTVIETNPTFAGLLGYGADGLPYPRPHPWWPDADTDAEAHEAAAQAFARTLREERGSFTAPLTSRAGRRLWAEATFRRLDDPQTGRRVIVGSFRDVTAEHLAVQRETATAALSVRLAEAATTSEALRAVLTQLRDLWQARHAVAALFTETAGEPEVMTDGDAPSAGDGVPGLGGDGVLSLSGDGVPGLGGDGVLSLSGDGVLRLDGDPALTSDGDKAVTGVTDAAVDGAADLRTTGPRPTGPRAAASRTAGGGGGRVRWRELPDGLRERLLALRHRPPLSPVVADRDGAGIALEHPGGRLVLWLDLGPHRPFAPADETLLALLAGLLGQGLHRAHQIDQQRATALALQRAILGPALLPRGFAVRYEPATRPLEVGGDWYDVVALPGGKVGIVVGDCVGRGLQAATIMGQLRSACRALLLQEPDPAAALAALDRFAALIPDAKCTTVFCAVLDPATGRLDYSSAGHPPGVLTVPGGDGAGRLLDEGRSLPLAVRVGRPRPRATCAMPPGSTLLLYTDGLVERRRRPLDEGVRRAAETLAEHRLSPIEDLADQLMTSLSPGDGYDDDVALLIYRHPAPLELTFPARPGQLGRVRTVLRQWLVRCGLAEVDAQNVLLAAGEACANAVEHGHRDTPGAPIHLSASADAHRIRVVVADTGTWLPPARGARSRRGRGMKIIREVMQEVVVTSAASGTTVEMQARITP